jgi:transposase
MDSKDRRIEKLETLLKAVLAENVELNKNSSNSSKPPSSDIVKPPKTKDKDDKKEKQKKGAQPGHEQHLRQPIASELVDEIVKLELTHCPDCGHELDLDEAETKITQQIELVEKLFAVTEYQQLIYCAKNANAIITSAYGIQQNVSFLEFGGVLFYCSLFCRWIRLVDCCYDPRRTDRITYHDSVWLDYVRAGLFYVHQ